jgi:hypothetical protein
MTTLLAQQQQQPSLNDLELASSVSLVQEQTLSDDDHDHFSLLLDSQHTTNSALTTESVLRTPAKKSARKHYHAANDIGLSTRGLESTTGKVSREDQKESVETREWSDTRKKRRSSSRRSDRGRLERHDSQRVSLVLTTTAPSDLSSHQATEGTVVEEATKRRKQKVSSTAGEDEDTVRDPPLDDIISSTVLALDRHKKKRASSKKFKHSEIAECSMHKEERKSRSHRRSSDSKSAECSMHEEERKSRSHRRSFDSKSADGSLFKKERKSRSRSHRRSSDFNIADGSLIKEERKSRSHRRSSAPNSANGTLHKEDTKSRGHRSSSRSQTTAKIEPVRKSLPRMPDLDCKSTSNLALRTSNRRSESFRLPKRAGGLDRTLSVPILSPTISVGSQGEDSRTEQVSNRGSKSFLFSKRAVRLYCASSAPNLSPTKFVGSQGEDNRTSQVSNLRNESFLSFKRSDGLDRTSSGPNFSPVKSVGSQGKGSWAELVCNERNQSFLFSNRADHLYRASSARNLSRLKPVGSRREDMVEAMRKNLEDYASSHAASQTEETIARMRMALDEVAAKPRSATAGTRQEASNDQLPWASSYGVVNNHVPGFDRLGESVVRHPLLPRQTSARLDFERIKRQTTITRRRSLADYHY